MLIVPLQAVPNQRLNVVLNGQNCTIILITRVGQTFISLLVDNNPVIQGRKISITPVVPYDYMQDQFNGNLIFINNDLSKDTNPNYKLFGISQSLVYYTAGEIA